MTQFRLRIVKDIVAERLMKVLAGVSLLSFLVMGGGLLYKSWPS